MNQMKQHVGGRKRNLTSTLRTTSRQLYIFILNLLSLTCALNSKFTNSYLAWLSRNAKDRDNTQSSITLMLHNMLTLVYAIKNKSIVYGMGPTYFSALNALSSYQHNPIPQCSKSFCHI